jgi:hypothetical protein
MRTTKLLPFEFYGYDKNYKRMIKIIKAPSLEDARKIAPYGWNYVG